MSLKVPEFVWSRSAEGKPGLTALALEDGGFCLIKAKLDPTSRKTNDDGTEVTEYVDPAHLANTVFSEFFSLKAAPKGKTYDTIKGSIDTGIRYHSKRLPLPDLAEPRVCITTLTGIKRGVPERSGWVLDFSPHYEVDASKVLDIVKDVLSGLTTFSQKGDKEHWDWYATLNELPIFSYHGLNCDHDSVVEVNESVKDRLSLLASR